MFDCTCSCGAKTQDGREHADAQFDVFGADDGENDVQVEPPQETLPLPDPASETQEEPRTSDLAASPNANKKKLANDDGEAAAHDMRSGELLRIGDNGVSAKEREELRVAIEQGKFSQLPPPEGGWRRASETWSDFSVQEKKIDGFMKIERSGLYYPNARTYVIMKLDSTGETEHIDALEWGKNGEYRPGDGPLMPGDGPKLMPGDGPLMPGDDN